MISFFNPGKGYTSLLSLLVKVVLMSMSLYPDQNNNNILHELDCASVSTEHAYNIIIPGAWEGALVWSIYVALA